MPDLNLSRDPSRTPMQWDHSPYAGFSKVKPWLRLPDNYPRINVKVQQLDIFSMLNFYKALIELRRREAALHVGNYESIFSDRQIIAYLREAADNRFLIVLNLTHRPSFFNPQTFKFQGKIELSTEPERHGAVVTDTIALSGDEGVMVRLEKAS
jgi:alpha-glucosidase